MKTLCHIVLSLILVTLLIALTGCEVTYSGGVFTASPNGEEIGRAIRVLSEK